MIGRSAGSGSPALSSEGLCGFFSFSTEPELIFFSDSAPEERDLSFSDLFDKLLGGLVAVSELTDLRSNRVIPKRIIYFPRYFTRNAIRGSSFRKVSNGEEKLKKETGKKYKKSNCVLNHNFLWLQVAVPLSSWTVSVAPDQAGPTVSVSLLLDSGVRSFNNLPSGLEISAASGSFSRLLSFLCFLSFRCLWS